MYSVAIVGRPNVGKSTLFNRLTGRRLALVDNRPGVTRDRREAEAQLFDLSFRVIDTAGLEDAFDHSLEARMRQQTERAVAQADLIVMIVDARVGITPMDEHFARWLRRGKTPIVLVANKCEGRQADVNRLQAYRLGLGEPVPYSAEHGLGASDLYDEISAHYRRWQEDNAPPSVVNSPSCDDVEDGGELSLELDEEGAVCHPVPATALQLAVMGRPNVGKSTLINRLLGEDRLLTGPEAGITRDAIAVDYNWQGRSLRLVDTAGLRKRTRVVETIEKMSVADSLRALRYAQVVVLVLDCDGVLDKQDLTIARTVLNEGRALVIAVNKWESCGQKKQVLQRLSDRLHRSLSQGKGLPVVTVSALKGHNLDGLLRAVFDIYDIWDSRIPTAKLNDWLQALVERHPPPAPGGRRIKLRYMTQARTRPPTFALSCSLPDDLPGSYLRFVENSLRERFDLPGVPLRLHLKKTHNPYADEHP